MKTTATTHVLDELRRAAHEMASADPQMTMQEAADLVVVMDANTRERMFKAMVYDLEVSLGLREG